ncbi:hypothetical protein OJJOAM_005058 [Cupriavidus sp. H18C1]
MVPRILRGEYSVICATTLGITPPMPRPARKRVTLNVTGSLVKPAAAVKTENSTMQMAMAQRRPMRSAMVPRKIAPNIMPNSAELTMKPACVASTPIDCMIDGRAMPATARS